MVAKGRAFAARDIERMQRARRNCPTWHFLPGPFQDDPSAVDCVRREDHAAMRERRSVALEQRSSSRGTIKCLRCGRKRLYHERGWLESTYPDCGEEAR